MEMKELVDACNCFVELQSKVKEIDKEKKKLNEEKEKLGEKILFMLDEFNLPNFRFDKGLISRRVVTGASITDKDALFDYLKQKGQFESLVSVHSRTLASWLKTEKEVAESQGEYELEVPGVKQTELLKISFREGK